MITGTILYKIERKKKTYFQRGWKKGKKEKGQFLNPWRPFKINDAHLFACQVFLPIFSLAALCNTYSSQCYEPRYIMYRKQRERWSRSAGAARRVTCAATLTANRSPTFPTRMKPDPSLFSTILRLSNAGYVSLYVAMSLTWINCNQRASVFSLPYQWARRRRWASSSTINLTTLREYR